MSEAQPRVSAEQIHARYQAGTMGYDSCIAYLMREHRMTEAQADEVLIPSKSLKR